jgi:Recombinase zinc beta ribbon domain/Recombinase
MLKPILRNERYAGRVVYRPRRLRGREGVDEAVPAAFPAIVSTELWAAAAAVRGRNAAHNGIRYARTARYALTGLLHCNRCGGTVHGVKSTTKNAKTYAYYVCRARYGSHSCSQALAPVAELETELRSWLSQLRLPDGFAEEFSRAIRAGRGKPAPAQRRTVKSIETRLERLRELFEMGDLPRAEYVRRRDALQQELADLAAAPPPIVQASETIATLTDDWDDLDGGHRRQVLETIFSELVLDEGRLVSATPRPGWLDYIERTGVLSVGAPVLVGRRRRESDPLHTKLTLTLVKGRLVPT